MRDFICEHLNKEHAYTPIAERIASPTMRSYHHFQTAYVDIY